MRQISNRIFRAWLPCAAERLAAPHHSFVWAHGRRLRILETEKTSHVRGAECVLPLDTKMRWRARSAAPFLYINLKACLFKRLLLRYGSPLSKAREVWAWRNTGLVQRDDAD